MTASIRLYLLGGFRLENTAGEVLTIPLRKAEALFAYLAMAPGKTASREKLATLLWGESDQQRARQSLRQALFALSREFAQAEVSGLRMESQMVSLDPDAVWVDACEFQALAAHGGRLELARASACYRGPFLQDFNVDALDFDDWLLATRTRLEETALKVFVELLDHQEEAGDISAAIETAQAALRIDSYREDIHRRLMRLYMAKGMRSSALHQYRQCRDFLERELGVPPDEDTNALYKSILEAGPSAAPDLVEPLEEPVPRPAPEPGRAAPTPVTVGREPELRLLNEQLGAARQGGCRLLAALGEAGVGKSHLLRHFVQDLAARDTPGPTARGRRTERSLSLGLWVDLLNDPALAGDAGLDERLPPPAREHLALLRSNRVHALDGAEGAGGDRRRLYDAVVELLRARSAQQPLAVVLDDLQWADEESLRLLAFVVRHLGEAPVLFVAAIRLEDLERAGLLCDLLRDLEDDGLLSLITLQPLTREATALLVERLQQATAGKAEPKAKPGEIWALSEGNPQIVVEILGLSAAGEAALRGGGAKLPERVIAEVFRALGSLGRAARELATTASVLGPRVEYDVLRRAVALDEEEVVKGVEELVAARILVPHGDDLAFARRRVRLALYETLLPQRRRALHAAAARTIEALHAGELAPHFDALAGHYREAGQAAKALECDLAAGVADMKRGAHRAARKLFQRALKMAQALPEGVRSRALEVDARLGLGAIAETEQDLGAAAAIFGGLEARFDRIESPRQRLAALVALSRVRCVQKDRDGAYDYARRALAEAGRAGGDCLWPSADCLLIRLHLINGALGRTIDRLAESRERARRLQLHEDEADAAAALGVLYALQGEFTLAADQTRHAVQVAEGLGDERHLAAALQFRGMTAMWQGSLEAALADLDKAGRIAEDRGDLLRLYSLRGHRAFALSALKRYEEAVEEFRRALDMASRLNTRILLSQFMAWMAEAAFEAGDHEEALHRGREAVRLAAETNQPWARSIALRTLARVLAHPEVRDLEGADKSIRSALAEQEGLGIKFETARSLIVQAKIMRSAGQTRRSSAIYGEASKLFEQMRMTGDFDSARHMAEVLVPVHDASAEQGE